MNRELIRRLYDQSVMKATEANPGISPCPAWAWEEAFVAAIVQECVSVMSATAKEANERFTYMGDDVPTSVHQHALRKHFGIDQYQHYERS